MKMVQRGNRNGGAHGNAHPIVMEVLRGIATRLEVVEIAQRIGRHIEDVSEDEEEEALPEQVANPPEIDLDEEF